MMLIYLLENMILCKIGVVIDEIQIEYITNMINCFVYINTILYYMINISNKDI